VTSIRVFVNEKPVDVAAPATVADAVTAFDATLGAALLAGTARATDARGIEVAPSDEVGHGSILRVFTSSRPHVLTSDERPHVLTSDEVVTS
jgi:hypothetical protein